MRSSSCPRVLLFARRRLHGGFLRGSPDRPQRCPRYLGGSVVGFFVVLQIVPSGVLGLGQEGEVEAVASQAMNSYSVGVVVGEDPSPRSGYKRFRPVGGGRPGVHVLLRTARREAPPSGGDSVLLSSIGGLLKLMEFLPSSVHLLDRVVAGPVLFSLLWASPPGPWRPSCCGVALSLPPSGCSRPSEHPDPDLVAGPPSFPERV